MYSVHNPTQEKLSIVQALQRLTEDLAAPDLTAVEAQVLQPKLLSLLDVLQMGNSLMGIDFAGDLTIACVSDRCAVA